MKLTLYLFIGSMLALVGALALYFNSGLRTFDLLALEKAGFPVAFQRFCFLLFFLALPSWGYFPLSQLGA